MLLNIVTDEELLASQIVKTILLFLTGGGILYNIFRIARLESVLRKVINACIIVILLVVFFFVVKEYRIEYALLRNPGYVRATTIRFCEVFARGQGVEFEYEVNGITYHNCNTFHPVSKDSIVVPGGLYMVRYSKEFPDAGRIDFRKKVMVAE